MRAALISIAGQPSDGEGKGALVVAGKSLARRQLDFALTAGCERVIVLGDGASGEAIALRHTAEDAGASFQTITDSRGLPGAVRAADELLVLAPGLLPEAAEALKALRHGATVLVLPAGPGITAGFERIDLDRAWAGVAVVPGALVERLSDLPADIEPASALMRAALQVRVPEHRLPEALLAEGLWAMAGHGVEPADGDRAWLKRHSRPMRVLPGALGELALRVASRLLAAPHSIALVAGAAAAILGGAIVAAWLGAAAFGFALIPPAVLAAGGAVELARLRAAPFTQVRGHLFALLNGLVDATIFACAVFAIEEAWIHRLFPPLVLLAALHLPAGPGIPAWVRNRGLLAASLALAAGFQAAEPVIMLAGLALLAASGVKTGAKRG